METFRGWCSLTGVEGAVCEVCAAAAARRDELLCAECSYAFTLMLELLHGHPDVDIKDLDRIRRVFEWRMRKKGLVASQPEAVEEEKKLASALSLRSSRQSVSAR
jgi:hypothetical protein